MTTTVLNTRISEVDNKIPNTSNLVTTTVLNTKISEVENKIPDSAKYITTTEFKKLTAENFKATLQNVNLLLSFPLILYLYMKTNIIYKYISTIVLIKL